MSILVSLCDCRAKAASDSAGGPASVSLHGAAAERAPAVRFVGRADQSSPAAIRYAWSGSGFLARFHGTGITVHLRDPGGNRHAVWIDGVLWGIVKTTETADSYPLAAGLPDGDHVVGLYRSTEALLGITTFLGIDVENGTLLAPPRAPDRRLEIVGDSISCGYGNEGKDPNCGFSSDTENHGLSYGALAARDLGAEVDTIAWSGRGVVRNYDGEPGETMPQLYDRVIPQEPKTTWDFSHRPQAVIVNLGTNDFSTEPSPSIGHFASAYAGLLERIRSKYPSAFLLCTIGPMLVDEGLLKGRKAVQEGVEIRRKSGDQNVVYHEMRTKNVNPGCDWHPSLETHAHMADELVEVLRKRLGW